MAWTRWGVLFLAVAAPCVAQAPSPDSISFGKYGTTTLHLGQTKDATLRSLRWDSDLTESNGAFIVTAKGDPKTLYGTLHFDKDDRLMGVWRNWTVSMPDSGVDVAQTILRAMSTFGKSAEECSVDTRDINGPEMESKAVIVNCGKHHVSIGTTRWLTDGSWHEAVDISESLGERWQRANLH
jgi:hypothetical protein